jgi:hypothetical protein
MEGDCGVTDGNPHRRGTILFETPPGEDFCVAMKMRIDSFLVTGADATGLVGGGPADTLRLQGYGFEAGTNVGLRAVDSERALPGRVLSRSWRTLEVEVEPESGDSGDWTVIVQNPSGVPYEDASQVVEIQPPAGGGRTWRVPADFPKVRDALDAAASGDTVLVDAGTFEGDHAWIVDKDRVVLRGAGANETIIRGQDDSILAIVRAEEVEVSGIAFVVDNEGIPLRVPMQLADAGSRIEQCAFVFSNCRVCAFITQPSRLEFVGNTVIRRGEGSNLFARVTPSTRYAEDLTERVQVRQVLSLGFDASFDCEILAPIETDCNWDPGTLLRWFDSVSSAQPILEDPDAADFRPVEGSLALPENNACGLLIGAVGR